MTSIDRITAEKAPKPRVRVRFANAVELFARAAGVQLDAAVRDRILEMTDDEFSALFQGITDNLGAVLRGVERPKVPSIDIQLENFSLWQKSKGVEYYRWPAVSMDALRARLIEFGDGVELIPCFAMSVQVKLRDGRIILLDR
jgi:hypothetical protein